MMVCTRDNKHHQEGIRIKGNMFFVRSWDQEDVHSGSLEETMMICRRKNKHHQQRNQLKSKETFSLFDASNPYSSYNAWDQEDVHSKS